MSHLIAVDGGNSKTDILLIHPSGRVLADVRTEELTPHLRGARASVARLHAAVRQAQATSNVNSPAALAVIHLAGIDLPIEADEYLAALAPTGIATRYIVDNDINAILRAGSVTGWGIAMVCGAGTNCTAIHPDGHRWQYLALGEITGDYGGGATIGMQALHHAVRAQDHRGPATLLYQLVCDHFHVDDPLTVAAHIHRGIIPPVRINELSPLVFTAAATGDQVAASIVQRLAHELALMVTAAALNAGLPTTSPVELVLGGSVLRARHPQLLEPMLAEISNALPHIHPIVLNDRPVLGTALTALDETHAHPEAASRLRDTLARGHPLGGPPTDRQPGSSLAPA